MGGADAADLLDDATVRRRPADAGSHPRVSGDGSRVGHWRGRAVEGDQRAGAAAADGTGSPVSRLPPPVSRLRSPAAGGAWPLLTLLVSLRLHRVCRRAQRGTRAQLLRA